MLENMEEALCVKESTSIIKRDSTLAVSQIPMYRRGIVIYLLIYQQVQKESALLLLA